MAPSLAKSAPLPRYRPAAPLAGLGLRLALALALAAALARAFSAIG